MIMNTVLETKEVWKGCREANGVFRWVLKKINLEFMEGEFVSILGNPAGGKSTLLKILGFLTPPDRGEVYFQGRLIGETGGKELEQMRVDKVWSVSSSLPIQTPPKDLAAVLLDKPVNLLKSNPNNSLLAQIRHFNSLGITVVMATQDPAVAAYATSIYKLSEGEAVKLNGNVK